MSDTAAVPHSPRPTHPVDSVPPAPKLAALGLQHVLAFYAGAVIVPLLIAGSLGLDEATTIHLINADLLTCGLATLIQSVGVGKHIGVRLPIIQGVTTTAVSPIIAIGLSAEDQALPTIYGAIIAIRQDDMKRLIAYSSLSHVGLMIAGVFSLKAIGLQGTVVQMLAHGVNVVGMFLVADAIADFSEAHHRMALEYAASRCAMVVTTDEVLE